MKNDLLKVLQDIEGMYIQKEKERIEFLKTLNKIKKDLEKIADKNKKR